MIREYALLKHGPRRYLYGQHPQSNIPGQHRRWAYWHRASAHRRDNRRTIPGLVTRLTAIQSEFSEMLEDPTFDKNFGPDYAQMRAQVMALWTAIDDLEAVGKEHGHV